MYKVVYMTIDVKEINVKNEKKLNFRVYLDLI